MNKDNLIEFAKDQCEIFPEDSYMGEYLRETLKMLQKEPCEDAISKASVFEIMGNLMSIPYDLDRRITEKDVSEAMDEIRVLPPVTPTRKKGKWTNGDPICPCCGEDKFKDLDADIWADWQPKYCPNCGSLMEVEA